MRKKIQLIIGLEGNTIKNIKIEENNKRIKDID